MGRARELAELAASYDTGNLFGMKNRIINGDMRFDQRNAGAAVTLTSGGVYTLDRWICWEDTDGGATVTQSSTAPAGYTNSLLYTVTSADASLAAAQFSIIAQRIEGFNVADLAFGSASAQAVTLSFWVRSSLTGTFAGSLVNSAGNRSYVFTYSIASANTWELKTVTIPGDTSGTWVTNNGIGLQVYFSMGVGTDRQSTAGSWAAGNFVATSGSVNVIGTNGATWHVTGVQLEAGSVATPFERRAYGHELALCQRYYYRMSAANAQFTEYGSGYIATTTTAQVFTVFPVTMRTAPTALEQNGTASHYGVLNQNISTNCNAVPLFGYATVYSARSIFNTAATLTVGQGSAGRAESTPSYLGWSAEL